MLSPSAILRPALAKLSPLSLDSARSLGRDYGIDVVGVESLALGSVNSNFRLVTADSRAYFARIYEEQERAGAEREIELLSRLSGQGVPVVRPLPPGVRSCAGKPFAVFPWVEGEWLCLQRVEAGSCRKVGEALARVHRADVPDGLLPEGRFRPSDMLARLERVRATGPAELAGDVAFVAGKYAEYGPKRDAALPGGVCHGDLFRDNVLWQGGEIAALLDFESVCRGSYVYDLMVTVFAWCYRSELELEHAVAMVDGYQSLRPLSGAEWAALEVESAFACLRFATTRITDFELRRDNGAPPVRDFRRFLARLAAVEAGVLGELRARVKRGASEPGSTSR